jgi:hypothetical protein
MIFNQSGQTTASGRNGGFVRRLRSSIWQDLYCEHVLSLELPHIAAPFLGWHLVEKCQKTRPLALYDGTFIPCLPPGPTCIKCYTYTYYNGATGIIKLQAHDLNDARTQI